ncbi:MAG TPA: excinuclease ABC subunit UvrA [Gemmataceae bacterium]|nr:excinuclease ABC subunit UvrA [Gemmataceae bacterium]
MTENMTIVVRGAREHNLQNVDLDLPRNKLVVFTGVSGSGKSSLAFDTLYAEGQRRYVESLSSYARQFLGQLQKPDVDYLGGLSPAISIQQKTAGRNPRSTVGTITEIYDYLRVLYARVGQGHCPQCGRAITAQTREQIIARVMALPEGARFLILAPMIRGQKGEYKDLLEDMLKRGFLRARVDGRLVRLTDSLQLDRRIKHHIEIVIDRLKNEPKVRTRLAEAVDQALILAEGTIIIAVEREGDEGEVAYDEVLLSAHHACMFCNKSYEPPTPQLFSFNSPHGMCLECDGLGNRFSFDPDLLIPNPELSFYDGALPIVGPLKHMGRWRKHIYQGVADTLGFDLKKPWNKMPQQARDWLLYGSGTQHITYEWKQRGGGSWKHGGTWEGIVPQLLSSFKKTAAGPRRLQLEKYMRVVRCPACGGQRLNPQARAVRLGGRTIVEVCASPLGELAKWIDPDGGELERGFDKLQKHIAGEVLKEIRGRVGFLLDVGLHYLTLDRSAPTLSGGEAQRIRLAGQIGCGLVGVLYILDEPSIGLHPRDNDRLLRSLERLRDLGNTVLVVEHDEDTMRVADFIVDFGPGPGVRGGKVVAAGTYAQIVADKESLTGQYLAGTRRIEIPKKRRQGSGKSIIIEGARHHNLDNVTVSIPLGMFVAVTGVSGSGKSSLINDILHEGARAALGQTTAAEEEEAEGSLRGGHAPGAHDRIVGLDQIDKVIDIDQAAIGRTPRSNPATYIKVFDEIRTLFAEMPEAKVRGYKSGRFSFNRPGGRCEACEGNGSNRLEMDFLADVWVTCPVCEGRRFNRETLQIRYKGKSIHDVLEMDVQEALEHFTNIPKIRVMLQTLHDVGLDYIKLGQSSPTLSGGEAQRIKLAKELCRRSTGRTLYILDEPTTGLHFDDIEKLLKVLHAFADGGNTVVVIEHNLDVIKTADWLIDLGPDGGSGGGHIVCVGSPETVAACPESFTGQALVKTLQINGKRRGKAGAKAARRLTEPAPLLENIRVEGAQQHNLKNVTLELPREQMSVFCGPSGSGKSSLALDTIYAEGQRRYIESLSSYARQFLGQLQKPKVEHVTGLSPAISIEQQTTSKSPRSTVGTVTEVYDFFRILYARLGQPYCPVCDLPIGTQTVDEIIDKIAALPEGAKFYLLAPIERRGQEKYEAIWEEIRRTGYIRMRVDGKSYNLDEAPLIDHRRKHDVEVVVDRLVSRPNQRGRLGDAVEAALELGRGIICVAYVDDSKPEVDWKTDRFSLHFACDKCGRSYEALNPHNFSFNSPLGWCPTCEGLGVQRGASQALMIRDPRKSLREGAIAAWPLLTPDQPFTRFAEALARHAGFSLDVAFDKLDLKHQQVILQGLGETWISLDAVATKKSPPSIRFQYKGLFPAIDEATRVSFVYRQKLDHVVSETPCSACQGSRLRPDAAAFRFQNYRIGELCALPLEKVLTFFHNLTLTKPQRQVVGEVLREITDRLQFLVDVGLEYLTLGRQTPTLSGGESQRIRLASQIGSGLTGVLYVLDEPTIGLHPRDNKRLLSALLKLRNLGNTMILVEHDREIIGAADHLVDFGPGAGDRGGEVTAQGTPRQVMRSSKSLTGQYLSGKKTIAIPSNRRLRPEDRAGLLASANTGPVEGGPPALIVKGARQHNLKNVDVAFPLGVFVAVTGVSGSGKSSLVNEVLYHTLARRLHRARTPGAAHDDILGLDLIDKVINVDQDPIGNSPSSNPATYTGLFDLVRQLYSQLPESKVRGYAPRRFSFNKPGGRCEACEGNGQKCIEMHFLPDVWVECDVCHGARYNPETLAVRYKNRTIADVLTMRVSEALEVFANIPKIRRILQTLADVGLEYLSLGQSASTLSGGEAQRVKLAAELSRPNTGRTVYLLDEPTTGLHFDDVHKLLEVLNRLVDLGNTVIVVEHNLDVIKTADWIIDLGPEAGEGGGHVVAQGTPEQIVQDTQARKTTSLQSYTAEILASVLAMGTYEKRTKFDPFAKDAPAPDDTPLESVGKDASMPWEADGRRWHVQDRVSGKGTPCHWEGESLAWLEKRIHELGTFSATNWNHRSTVEIAAPRKSVGWFLHAMTNMEWLVRFVFRVGKNTFKQGELIEQLGIRPLNETEGVQAYSSDDRVWVDNLRGPWQSVTVLVHRLSEIETPAFERFLTKAVESFNANIKRLQTKPEDLMPWKLNGEKWHLGEKGFPPGRKLYWDRAVLKHAVEMVRAAVPDVELKWDNRVAIMLRLPGCRKAWAHWRTKDNTALYCRFLGKKGQINLSKVEGIGVNPELETGRQDGDVLQLVFLNLGQLAPERFKAVLQELASGFRQNFAK